MKKKLATCLMTTMVHRLGICATEKKSRWLKGLELEAQIPDPQPYDLEQIIFLSLSQLIYRLAMTAVLTSHKVCVRIKLTHIHKMCRRVPGREEALVGGFQVK